MGEFKKTFVLIAVVFSVWSFESSAQYAQENQAARSSAGGSSYGAIPSAPEEMPMEAASTRLQVSSFTGGAASLTDNITLTAYTASLEQDLTERITLMGSIPMVLGSDNGTSFNQWGNPFAGARIRLIELQEFHPLWFTVHGGVAFANQSTSTPANVIANYQEIHTGASLIKHFSGVEVITDGDYIQKTDDSTQGLTLGNELDAYAGLKIGLTADWTLLSGYVLRHADPTRINGGVTTGEDLYQAAELGLNYRLTPAIEIMGKYQLPIEPDQTYLKNLAAFGDVVTQGTLGKSWTVGLGVGI